MNSRGLRPGRPSPRHGARLTCLTVASLEVGEAEADVGLQLVLTGAPVLARIRGTLVPICGGVALVCPGGGPRGWECARLLTGVGGPELPLGRGEPRETPGAWPRHPQEERGVGGPGPLWGMGRSGRGRRSGEEGLPLEGRLHP